MSETIAPIDTPVSSTVKEKNVLLRAEDITKVFPGTVALDHVDFNVYHGKVNVLVGENGAGKSTLMKILAGVETPTAGRLFLEGKEICINSIQDAGKYGIGIIYQEMNLCANLSVAENIYLARELTHQGIIVNNKTEKENANRLIQHLEQRIDPDALVADLRIGQQQIVEITKALAQDVKILIMDEPTSALSAAEVEVLFRVIRELKASGVSIIYISHKLEELLQIGDYITVLRDGHVVAEAEADSVDVAWIIEKMVGKNLASVFKRREHKIGNVLLRVEDLSLPRLGGGYVVDHVSFSLHSGEILGLYGLMGAGRSDLVDCLAGSRQQASGRIWINDEEINVSSVTDRIQAGIVLVPEDRQRDGLVPTLSVAHNMVLASLKKYLSAIFLTPKKENGAIAGMIKDLSIRVANPGQPITSLSGGNQQKVVVAKGLLTTPKILMLDEPTRGIDIGAKAEIFEIMSRLADQGYGVIFVSSELKEVLAMSDRILVLSKGLITGEFNREEATEEKLVTASAVGHRLAQKGNNNGGDNGSKKTSRAN